MSLIRIEHLYFTYDGGSEPVFEDLDLVGTMLWAFLSAGGADTIAVGVMALYGVVGLAVVGGVLAALIQRLREIKRGEEEDAKKY